MPFVIQYHPALPKLKNILMGKWHLTKNYGTQQKTNTTAMYINSILSIEIDNSFVTVAKSLKV